MSKCIHGVSLRKTCGDCLNDSAGYIKRQQARAQLAAPDGVREWVDVATSQPGHNEWVIIRWNGQFKVGQFDSKHPFLPAIVDRMAGKYWNFSEWSPVEAAAPTPAPTVEPAHCDVVSVPREVLERAVADAESWYAIHGEPWKGDYYAAHVDLQALLKCGRS